MTDEALSAGETCEIRRLTTVVAADICGYSRLAENDEAAAIRTVKLVRTAFEQIVARRRGRIFSAAGDGFLAEFPSAADGVLAALEFVADISARNRLSPTNPGASVRAGVHAGDVVEQPNGDLLGHGVNVAARLQAEAEPNGVVASLHVVNLVRGAIDANFHRRGPLALKNIDEPVVAFDATTGVRRLRSLWSLARVPKMQVVSVAALLLTATFAYLAATMLVAIRRPPPTQLLEEPSALLSLQPSQEATEIDEARRALKLSTLPESDDVWLRGMLSELRRSGEAVDREVFKLLANHDLSAAINKLKSNYETRKPSLTDAQRVPYLLTLGALTFDLAPGDSVAFHRAVLDFSPDNFTAQLRLGELYYSQSDYARAARSFERALEIGSKNPDQEVYATIKYAASLTVEEKYEDATRLLASSLAEAEANGWDSLVILAYNRVAYVELKRKNFDAARKALTLVTTFARSADYPEELAFAFAALGRMELEGKNLSLAKTHFDKSIALEKEIGRPVGLADSYFYMGLIEIELGDPKRAEGTFQTALEIARGARSFGYNNLKNMEVKNHIGKALAYKEQGLDERACLEMRAADEIDAERELIYNPQTTDLVHRIGCPFGPLGYLIARN